NEGISPRHNPEFTMMELYQAYGDYRTMMDLTEGLVVACVDTVLGRSFSWSHNESLADYHGRDRKLPFGEHVIDFTLPWKRAKYADLFLEHVGVSMDDVEGVRRRAVESKVALELVVKDPATKAETRVAKAHDVLVHELFEHHVEDKLVGPVFVYDYPAALCPLTKRQRGNPQIAERFELYVRAMELANAYTELNDPVTQEQTFQQQLAGLPQH